MTSFKTSIFAPILKALINDAYATAFKESSAKNVTITGEPKVSIEHLDLGRGDTVPHLAFEWEVDGESDTETPSGVRVVDMRGDSHEYPTAETYEITNDRALTILGKDRKFLAEFARWEWFERIESAA